MQINKEGELWAAKKYKTDPPAMLKLPEIKPQPTYNDENSKQYDVLFSDIRFTSILFSSPSNANNSLQSHKSQSLKHKYAKIFEQTPSIASDWKIQNGSSSVET